MVNNNIPQILQGIYEIESSYNNISCVLSSFNIKQVIRPYLLSKNILDEDINKRLDSFLSNIWQNNITLNNETVSIVTDYYSNYLGFEDFILEDFINFTVREDINRLVELRYIGSNKGRKEERKFHYQTLTVTKILFVTSREKNSLNYRKNKEESILLMIY